MKNTYTVLKSYIATKYFRNFDTREKLTLWQDRKVQEFLAKIVPLAPFYKKYYAGLPLSQWINFPIVDKAIWMKHFDEVNTPGIKKEEAFQIALEAEKTRDFSPMIGEYTVGLSSGTSGNRGIYLMGPKERFEWAGRIIAKTFPNSILSKNRVALFLRADSNFTSTLKRKRIDYCFFDLLNSVEKNVNHINQYQPTLLAAPASMLRILAETKAKGQLKISPEKIFSVAEVLDPLDHTYISSQFCSEIHQIYQCTEGFLGYTCPYGTIHLNEDTVAIQKEYLDVKLRKFVPIITDFRRYTQPIIRYRLNDILAERESSCPCGSVFTAIDSIEGRCDDLFYIPSIQGKKLIPVFPDFISRAVICTSPEIIEYQVVQHSPMQLEIALKVSEKARLQIENQVTQSLQALFTRLECRGPEIRYVDYEMINRPKDRKLRRIERRFELETDN